MNENDYDEDGNCIVDCPLCLTTNCPSVNDGGECPIEKRMREDPKYAEEFMRTEEKSVEESNIIEKDGDYYIKFVAHEEVVKRNRQQTRKERDAEIVEWVKKEIRNAPLEVKMSGSSMILGKLIKHITTPDHD